MNKAQSKPQIPRLSVALAVAAIAAILAAPGSASADTGSGANITPIAIPAAGQAPSSAIEISGVTGPVSKVTVRLNRFYHTHPSDVDVLLVSPTGRDVTLMSDACGADDIENFSWVFSKTQATAMPETDCGASGYKPTNLGAKNDGFIGIGASGDTDLGVFDGEDPNGSWFILVLDDSAGDSGELKTGWSLLIETADVDARLPATGAGGRSGPYPLTTTVSGRTGIVSDVNVRLEGVRHDRPDDLDLLLVGPQGQKAVLMSDACGDNALGGNTGSLPGGNLVFDDESAVKVPDGLGLQCLSGALVQPADYEPGDVWPDPAPTGPYTASLSAFDFTDPNGEWKLYAQDDLAPGGTGWLLKRPALEITTRAKAPVTIVEPALQVAEGTTGTVTLRRTAESPLGPASVTVATQPGTAAPGADFTPVATTVQFAAGEAEKTVGVDVLADAEVEPDETFTVALASPTGDAALGTPSATTVTIPAQQAAPEQPRQPDGRDGPKGPTAKPKVVVTVATGKKVARDGTLKVRVRCSAACAGRVALTTRKPRKLKLGSPKFALPKAGTKTLKVKVPKKARRALARAKRVKVAATTSLR